MIIVFLSCILVIIGIFLDKISDKLMYTAYHAENSWYEVIARKKSNRYHVAAILCLVVAFIILLIGLINY